MSFKKRFSLSMSNHQRRRREDLGRTVCFSPLGGVLVSSGLHQLQLKVKTGLDNSTCQTQLMYPSTVNRVLYLYKVYLFIYYTL